MKIVGRSESFNEEDCWISHCSEHAGSCPLDVAPGVEATSLQSCRGRNDVEAADRKQSPFVVRNAKFAAQNSRQAKTEVLASLKSVEKRV